jgi:glycine/D-amino acid oxidase-like deaminating enzyme
MTAHANGEVSFWYTDTGGRPNSRAELPGNASADVVIIGAGYTGLWTAYYLKQASPDLRIVILEKEFAGFGASGRNGGWLTSEFGWSRERYAERFGRSAVISLQRLLRAAVDEVIDVCLSEGIDADIVKGGALQVATTPAQRARLAALLEHERAWSVSPEDAEWLSRDDTRERIQVAGALASIYSPHHARIQPAKLARGLAHVVELLGVRIFENTCARTLRAGEVTTDRGRVSADYVVRATEGFTAGIDGLRRQWLPMNSAMIVTEPVDEHLWDQIGWHSRELLSDTAHAYMYAQRTLEGRIAIGGRGVPYRFGSKTDVDGRTQPRTVRMLEDILVTLFPMLRGVAVDHAWCGVIGVPRDWCASVGLDRATGMAWAGGYVGVGVATSNLAARTLRDLILDLDGPESRLPWVNHRVRPWEPEPLRWIGVRSLNALYRTADVRERNSGTVRTSPLAKVADLIAGRR